MNKFIIKLAKLNIEINCRYDYTFNMCKDYLVKENNIDIIATCNEEDIDKYSEESSKEVGEFIALYESIAKNLTKFNRVLIHGAAIEYNELAYLFLADSGVGKSTHIKLWKDNIAGVTIINGDKPIIDENGYIYGTPWSGKEKWNTNKACKLGGIILLNRDSYNHIEETTYSDNLSDILNRIFKDSHFAESMTIIDNAFKDIPIYKLGCTVDPDAAKVCFDKVIKNK